MKKSKYSFIIIRRHRILAIERVVKQNESKTSLRVRHTLNKQPYGKQVLCVQWDLQYGNYGAYKML
jgi:hypothetical protein